MPWLFATWNAARVQTTDTMRRRSEMIKQRFADSFVRAVDGRSEGARPARSPVALIAGAVTT